MISDMGEREYKKSKIFTTIPKGIIITDTFNCPNFPLTRVSIDKSHISEIHTLRKEYIEKYEARLDNFLPYHYVVEYIKNRYEIINTRPINYKSLLYNKEDYIVIAVMGNTNEDIYKRTIYKTIASVINPFRLLPGWRIKHIMYENIGANFQKENLEKMLL